MEDEPDFRAILGSWLDSEFDLIQLSQAEEEDVVESIAALQPDLVILDVHLPGLDGFEICGLLRRRPETARTPVLFLTGAKDDDLFVRSLDLGASGYLTKPVQRSALRRKVREALAGSCVLLD